MESTETAFMRPDRGRIQAAGPRSPGGRTFFPGVTTPPRPGPDQVDLILRPARPTPPPAATRLAAGSEEALAASRPGPASPPSASPPAPRPRRTPGRTARGAGRRPRPGRPRREPCFDQRLEGPNAGDGIDVVALGLAGGRVQDAVREMPAHSRRCRASTRANSGTGAGRCVSGRRRGAPASWGGGRGLEGPGPVTTGAMPEALVSVGRPAVCSRAQGKACQTSWSMPCGPVLDL